MAHQDTSPNTSSGSIPASTQARSGSGTSSLARGKACLRCRKRKMRCDGNHPACAQCARAHKADQCQYDDGRGKTRTQALRERIVRLEAEIQRLREGQGDSSIGSPGGGEDGVFLMDPHAVFPSASSSGSESALGELDFVDFGADAFGPGPVPAAGIDIERPTTSLSDPSASTSAPIFTDPMSFDESPDEYEGGVQRNRTIRPRDRYQTGGGLQQPRERLRPSSGVFGYSANHPLVQQAQAYGSPYQAPFYQSHSRASSIGSLSPSSSTVGSIGGHVGHGQNMGASPYSNYAEPLSLEPSPFPSPDPSMFASTVPAFASMSLDRDIAIGISPETESTLMQLVFAHRDQVGLMLHPARVLTSLSSPSETSRHHPVLKDAIMMFGAYFARRACGSAFIDASIEKALLMRVQVGISDALKLSAVPPASSFQRGQSQSDGSASPAQGQSTNQGNEKYSDPALDALQAQLLLARYLFADGRASEARIQLAGASDVVLQLGMHQLCAPNVAREAGSESARPNFDSVAGTLQLSPPSDSVSLGERVALFWGVLVLDRMVAAALGLPPCIADDECVETRIDTPWPEDVEEYENIPMESIHSSATLRSFFINQGLQVAGAPLGGFAPPALLAKATSVYAACARTGANWGVHSCASPPPAIFACAPTTSVSSQRQGAEDPTMAFAHLEACLARLASTLLPAQQLGAGLPDNDRRKQIVLHTLIHSSIARLHSRLARAGGGASLEKCVRAARAAANLVRTHVNEKDYALLDPLLGSCWSALAEIFTLDPVRTSAATPGSPANSWARQDHSTLLAAMARLQGQGGNNTQGYLGIDSNSSPAFQRALAL